MGHHGLTYAFFALKNIVHNTLFSKRTTKLRPRLYKHYSGFLYKKLYIKKFSLFQIILTTKSTHRMLILKSFDHKVTRITSMNFTSTAWSKLKRVVKSLDDETHPNVRFLYGGDILETNQLLDRLWNFIKYRVDEQPLSEVKIMLDVSLSPYFSISCANK